MSGEAETMIYDDPMPTAAPAAREFDDVMIDIETMSLHPHRALILSIGMVQFNPSDEHLRIGHHDLLLPSIEQQLALGRHVDRKTQEFWRSQPNEAQRHWLNYQGERMSAYAVLQAVRGFVKGHARVWAKGPQFDLSNLLGLAEDIGSEDELWHYRAPRDVRTLIEHVNWGRSDPNFQPPFKLVQHEPVSDCIHQAMQVWEHWQGEIK